MAGVRCFARVTRGSRSTPANACQTSTQQQLYAHNKKQLESLVDYTLLPHRPQNIMYQLKWMPHSSTALAQPPQGGARVLLVGPVGPASAVVLQLKVLLRVPRDPYGPRLYAGRGWGRDCHQLQ